MNILIAVLTLILVGLSGFMGFSNSYRGALTRVSVDCIFLGILYFVGVPITSVTTILVVLALAIDMDTLWSFNSENV